MCLILGGASKEAEAKQLIQSNLIIATPGRCLDHLTVRCFWVYRTTNTLLKNTKFNFKNLRYLVLDEADQLIDSGFDQTIKMIVIKLPTNKMTYLFSATMSSKVEDLAVLSLRKNPLRIGLQDSTSVSTLEQKYVQVPGDKKYAALLHILHENQGKKMICFVAIKKAVDYVSYLLQCCNIENIALHVCVVFFNKKLIALKRVTCLNKREHKLSTTLWLVKQLIFWFAQMLQLEV